MDFVTSLLITTNWKRDSYKFILVIVDWLTKMVYYKTVKITINIPRLSQVIIDLVVRHNGLFNSIVTDRGLLFISKFGWFFCYFLGLKWQISTTFYSQTNSQIKRQNSIIKAYLRAFVNFEQNDWARLLVIAEFAYNNAKNASINHIPFELNCGYHPHVSFEKDINPCSKSKTADKLSAKLKKLMTVCQKNLHHAQELQKQAHNKGVKPKSCTTEDKVWLNSKYLKTKQNW